MRAAFYKRRAGGFSLVEVLVGMAIGLLGIMVMLQMLSVSEQQKRTTAGSDTAQNAGAIALYGMQRDIRQSGYDISSQRVIGCDMQWTAADGAAISLNGVAPVTINPSSIPSAAHDANTDTVMVVYGNGNGPGEGVEITAQNSQTEYAVQSYTVFSAGDYVVAQYAMRQTTCSLILDKIGGFSGNNPLVNTGVANITTTNTSAGDKPMLFNLGPSPKVLVYAVRNGNLAVCDYLQDDCGSATYATINSANEAVWVPIGGDIVSLKAQYGRDTAVAGSMDGIVDTYDQTTPTADQTTTACNWARVSAVRIALVARAGSGASTTAAPTWNGSAGDPINLSALPSWQNYRYKVFETVVPIRNITVQGAVSGC